MIPATLPLDTIYGSIAEQLAAVRKLFDEELQCDLPFVDELCAHISRYRGKMLRPALTLLSAQACGGTRPEHITIAAVLEMVHMATLVHDDVLDEAVVRRQLPTLHCLTNNETAVLLGDYLISHAYRLCSSLDSQYVSRTVASCTNTVCEGELLQVHNRNNWDLTQDEYLTIISRKTAALTSVACMLGAKYAGADAAAINALESFGMDAGVAFQIVDDVLDLIGSERETGKTLGRDLDKAKPTLPVIHFRSTADGPARARFMRASAAETFDRAAVVREMLNGSVEYALALARQRVQSALRSLQGLPHCSARHSLEALAEFIIQRQI